MKIINYNTKLTHILKVPKKNHITHKMYIKKIQNVYKNHIKHKMYIKEYRMYIQNHIKKYRMYIKNHFKHKMYIQKIQKQQNNI